MRVHPFLLPALLLATLPCQAPAAPIWHTDFAAARKLAAERRAPMFVTFRCER